MTRRVTLLGPQRLFPCLREAVLSLDIQGTIATVTAGWEDGEDEDDELTEHLEGRALNLRLFRRSEAVFADDPELWEAVRARHDDLRALQEVYRLRLGYLVAAALELMGRDAEPHIIEPEIDDMIGQVHSLDLHHLERVRGVHEAFVDRWRPTERDSVAKVREAIAVELDDAEALAIAGGHVVVLLNRLRLFDLEPLLGDRPVLAWSAGAMALTDQVVLFHDSPPQGAGAAELLETGLGMAPGLVALPDARRRLRIDDPTRVGLLARRMSPSLCAALDERVRFEWNGTSWRGFGGARALRIDGTLGDMA